MWSLLNPLNWIKILTLLKGVWDIGVSIYGWITELLKKRAQGKEIEKIHDAEKQIDEANKIEDDATRLKEKADAACKLEQTLDPERKC